MFYNIYPKLGNVKILTGMDKRAIRQPIIKNCYPFLTVKNG